MGSPFGPTRLVNAILAPHLVGRSDAEKRFLHQKLKRQDIEAWLNKGVELGDDKFRFIDEFVRRISISDIGYEIRMEVFLERIRRAAALAKSLISELVIISPDIVNVAKQIQKSFTFGVVARGKTSFILSVDFEFDGALVGKILRYDYQPSPPEVLTDEEKRSIIGSLSFAEIILIPISIDGGGTIFCSMLACDAGDRPNSPTPFGIALHVCNFSSGFAHVHPIPSSLAKLFFDASEVGGHRVWKFAEADKKNYEWILKAVTPGYVK